MPRRSTFVKSHERDTMQESLPTYRQSECWITNYVDSNPLPCMLIKNFTRVTWWGLMERPYNVWEHFEGTSLGGLCEEPLAQSVIQSQCWRHSVRKVGADNGISVCVSSTLQTLPVFPAATSMSEAEATRAISEPSTRFWLYDLDSVYYHVVNLDARSLIPMRFPACTTYNLVSCYKLLPLFPLSGHCYRYPIFSFPT